MDDKFARDEEQDAVVERSCPDCGSEMDLVDPSTTPGGRAWECPDCQRAVREREDDDVGVERDEPRTIGGSIKKTLLSQWLWAVVLILLGSAILVVRISPGPIVAWTIGALAGVIAGRVREK